MVDIVQEQNFYLKTNVNFTKLFKFEKSFWVEFKDHEIEITHFVKVNLFNHEMDFLVVDFLEGYDFLLGKSGLNKIKAIINFHSFVLSYVVEIPKENEVIFTESKLDNKKEDQDKGQACIDDNYDSRNKHFLEEEIDSEINVGFDIFGNLKNECEYE